MTEELGALSRRLARLRRPHADRSLGADDVAPDPLVQFGRWMADALEHEVSFPNAMTLATATSEGRPSARIVLLKAVDERGFVFYTNFESRKGRELAENPAAALVFYWQELERQVRIEGRVSSLPTEEAAAYFRTRPRGSRLGAWASRQSEVVASRHALEGRLEDLGAEYRGREIPLPPYWGGYVLDPSELELWQGRSDRLHDRLRYRRSSDGSWLIERLSP